MYFLTLFAPVLIYCLFRFHLRSRCKGHPAPLDFSQQRMPSLRGMLAALIVLHHFSQKYVAELPMLTPFLDIGMPVVAAFFFLSGFGLSHSLVHKGRAYIGGFLSSRTPRLVAALLIITITAGILRVHLYESTSWPQFAHNITHHHAPVNTWFMYPLLFAYIAFYACSRLTKCNALRTGLWLTLCLAALCAWMHRTGFSGFWYASTMALAAGYFTALYSHRIDTALSRRYTLPAAALLLFAAGCTCKRLTASAAYVHIPLNCITALLVYLAVRAGGTPQWPWLRTLGKYSLEIYLTHGLWLEAARHMHLGAAPAALLTAAGTAASAYALHTLLARAFARAATDKLSASAPTA